MRRRFPDVPTPDLSFEETVSTAQRKVSGLGGDRRVRIDHGLILEGTPVPRPGWLELVVAHECWHTIEIVRYRDTFELRRALGEELGVPTFEAAYVAMHDVAPERRAAALARIRAAVGNYATTKAIEGTAELFARVVDRRLRRPARRRLRPPRRPVPAAASRRSRRAQPMRASTSWPWRTVSQS